MKSEQKCRICVLVAQFFCIQRLFFPKKACREKQIGKKNSTYKNCTYFSIYKNCIYKNCIYFSIQELDIQELYIQELYILFNKWITFSFSSLNFLYDSFYLFFTILLVIFFLPRFESTNLTAFLISPIISVEQFPELFSVSRLGVTIS